MSRVTTLRALAPSPPWYKIRTNWSRKHSPMSNSRPTSRRKNKKNWKQKKRLKGKKKLLRKQFSRRRPQPRKQPTNIRKKIKRRVNYQVLRLKCRLSSINQPIRKPSP